MSEVLSPELCFEPSVNHIITEDDTPVDNFFSEKLQRLLTEVLYASWEPGIPFLAGANVGIFAIAREPAIVPDVFLSLDVEVAENWLEKKHRSYFMWEFGKPPEVAIEIVSNREGEELERKLKAYQRMRVSYYVVYDPAYQLGEDLLRIYELRGTTYEQKTDNWLATVGLGLTLWEGEFEGKQFTWLRWCDRDGNLIPTGAERAETERQRAEVERQRAEAERQIAETERQRAEQAEQKAALLAQKLRELGVDPETFS
jgi:Uma2 family endonuclease